MKLVRKRRFILITSIRDNRPMDTQVAGQYMYCRDRIAQRDTPRLVLAHHAKAVRTRCRCPLPWAMAWHGSVYSFAWAGFPLRNH